MSEENAPRQVESRVRDGDSGRSVKKYVTAVYALYAVSYFIGITIVIAVIIAYVKRSEAQGTWLESHFRWQTRTFWFGLLWFILALSLLLVQFFAIPLFLAIGLWFIYRIVRGWWRLAGGKKMYT